LRGKEGEIRDPSDVEQNAVFPLVSKQDVIRKRHQRRPLPPRREIGSAEVADDGASYFGGNERRVEPWIVLGGS